VYGSGTLAAFPGILKDPLLYDLGLCFVPVSFVVMGVLGGGFATLVKRMSGVDLRGRGLELAVVLWTFWLTVISWGLILGFFGMPSACYGTFGKYELSTREITSTVLLRAVYNMILRPTKSYYLMWDRLASNSGSWLSAALCSSGSEGCFAHLPHANAEFFTSENGGQACASDLRLVSWLYLLAGVSFVGTAVWKRRERDRRRRRPVRGEPRPHQD
jgi:hypothetical protein